ncbi:DUF4390 domain-containing protein [Desulfobulbus oligotrophicus]|uniref:DUF4390 domain-containing protein n=1 Tax=Desulfobulbus oligotrophicus TaxID=1909699 RepID=A0A7T5VF60_9BACT|nr:DUF4390 domain-containing protein [Desulfobulbus oligotrophicus]MDY0391409.1 DUF4390 domain-containing protein [Desulfobulbus oligotrophicus]QQG66686.1 DUF4390 domain-containing protein [Desulfobulbus oligotrophicus]
MKHVAVRLVTLHFLILLFLASSAFAKPDTSPEIKDIIVTTSETDLLLFATVKNGFTQRMLEDLNNGIPIDFIYQMELIMTGNRFLNTTLMEATITHTLQYDQENKRYHVTFSEKNDKSFVTDDLSRAKQLMAELNGVKIIPLSQLVPDAPYAIHFKVTLKKGALPLGMHRFLPFSSLWNFETDWRTIEFRY